MKQFDGYSPENEAARKNMLNGKIASLADPSLRKKYEEYRDSLAIVVARLEDPDIRNKPSSYNALYKLIKFNIRDEKNSLQLLPDDIWRAHEENELKGGGEAEL